MRTWLTLLRLFSVRSFEDFELLRRWLTWNCIIVFDPVTWALWGTQLKDSNFFHWVASHEHPKHKNSTKHRHYKTWKSPKTVAHTWIPQKPHKYKRHAVSFFPWQSTIKLKETFHTQRKKLSLTAHYVFQINDR